MKCFCHKQRLAALLIAFLMLFSSTALAARYSTLEYGDQGEDVLKLQKAMLYLGYDPSGTDGKFGRGTERAVKRYQTANKLEADGKAGNQTLCKLYEDKSISANGSVVSSQTILTAIGASSGSGASGSTGSGSAGNDDLLSGLIQNVGSSTNPNTLKYGDSGYRVTELQTLLNKLGYSAGTIDGKFGTGTLKALVQFQKDNGLNPDGMAGTQTLQLLSQKLAEEQSKPPTGDTLNELIQNANTSTNPDTIKYGDRGSKVTELQTLLTKLGYSVGGVDGKFGTGTLKALVQFQKDNNLVADGMAGTQTMNLIKQKAAALGGGSGSSGSGSSGSGGTASDTATGATGIPSVLTRTLYPGHSGQDVLTVQKRLKELGYYTGLLDGVYGTGTGNAVRSFQARNGLTADGIAGARTFKAMYIGNPVPAAGTTDSGTSGSGSGSSGSTGGSTGSTGYTTLQYGSRGEAVRQLQTALKKLNYNVSADGEYGALTQMAVKAFQQHLIDQGATVIVIEHDLDVIRSADYIVDMGPGGGKDGGEIVAFGTPEAIRQNGRSATGRYL